MEKVLVLASGGLDSSVLIALYHNLGYDVHVLYVDYGNVNSLTETGKLHLMLNKLGIPTKPNYRMCRASMEWIESVCTGNGTSQYVPMRNLVFLSMAVSLAESEGIKKIGIGLIDAFEYSDTSDTFIADIDILSTSAVGIKVEAPLKNLTKAQVFQLGNKLGISLTDTHSCNVNNKACGKCQDCRDIQSL